MKPREKVTFIALDDPDEITDESMFDSLFSLVGLVTVLAVVGWLLEKLLP